MKFGVDRLLADPALRKPLEGRRAALLAHPASVTQDLTHSLDALAAWQMRHLYCLIHRRQALSATITGVNQPSSANERSSINPCDR